MSNIKDDGFGTIAKNIILTAEQACRSVEQIYTPYFQVLFGLIHAVEVEMPEVDYLGDLAERLISKSITAAEWQAEMREYIRTIHREAVLIAYGGRHNVTQAAWGYEGYLVKEQYKYLDGFMRDIQANPKAWMNGRLLTRMRLYEKAEWATFEAMIRFQKLQDGYTEERRNLGAADHCHGCLQQAGMGWQPIGTLAPIGSQECATNCHCVFGYRK